MLHITNGDSVVEGLRSADLAEEFLAWRAPLHHGPVPATDSLPQLSAIRAQTLAGFGWGISAGARKLSFGSNTTCMIACSCYRSSRGSVARSSPTPG